jgi:Outer membrane protein beta-barrel domain
MKKCLLLVFLLVATITVSLAQSVKFNARIGTSGTSFNPTYSFASSSFGLLVGVGAEYDFSASLKVFATADYHQLKGVTSGVITTTSEYVSVAENSATIHLGELTVSGAYKLPLNFLGDIAPFITAGGSVGYNFFTNNRTETTYSYSTYQLQSVSNNNVTSEYAPFLYSIQGGVRFEIPLDDGIFNGLLFDFRYRRNINAITNGLSLLGNGDPADKYANSVIATVGFQF